MTTKDKLFIIGVLILPTYFLQSLWQIEMGYPVSSPFVTTFVAIVLVLLSFKK